VQQKGKLPVRKHIEMNNCYACACLGMKRNRSPIRRKFWIYPISA